MLQVKRILAVMLLFMYGIVVIHAILPHEHFNSEHNFCELDDHTSVEHHNSHEHVHGHHHSHHHGEKDVDDKSFLSSLLGFLGDLSHQDLGDGHFEYYLAQTFASNIQLDVPLGDQIEHITPVVLYKLEIYRCDFTLGHDPPPKQYESSHISSSSLRGPPSLV